ncbi:long-chain fatty aldehyde decarbonylase [Aestuariibaculum sediminum]|uniref:Long-chain fatty aldehyde decarbonylase n=1 Tax=Aestuariibaculum sediminum TaxID=2770637 RepID=A0A8J6QA54_9FLAO|nr:long-chain fatty aldehyde decarbonylase [Aestuariibaculum sediminum]MBD0831576.1 long-chain fatty aldehyde decarbonylase [Aestuariibaculum sediminum]
METLTNNFKSIEEFQVISDVFSQAITGELIGMSNFASLSGTIEDPFEKMEAIEHANGERQHAEGFMAYAKKTGLNININLNGSYWGRIRDVFLSYANKNDFIACLMIQEVMLEAFAVSMYTDVGRVLEDEAQKLFLSIAEEEKEHMDHSTEILRSELKKNPDDFIRKIEIIHYECMTILSEFSARTDLSGHCGVCHGDCMKNSLHHIGLDVVTMRGNALALYAEALDNIGIPGEKSVLWIANLPA